MRKGLSARRQAARQKPTHFSCLEFLLRCVCVTCPAFVLFLEYYSDELVNFSLMWLLQYAKITMFRYQDCFISVYNMREICHYWPGIINCKIELNYALCLCKLKSIITRH